MAACWFCKCEAQIRDLDYGAEVVVDCPRCGKFEIAEKAWLAIDSLKVGRATVSGWIQEQNSVGVRPRFDSKNIEQLKQLRKPGLKERSERYLLAAVDRSPTLQTKFDTVQDDLIGISYSHDAEEVRALAGYLESQGWLSRQAGGGHEVTCNGHIAADELRSYRTRSSQGFVAMWFADGMSAAYEDGFDPAIRKAGYKPLRIDKREDVVKIDDEILAEIRRSAFIVADFTGHRGGVYFEAGFAMGLGLPIVWTCRDDHMNDLHFDIRQYNCLSWIDAGDLATRLQKRIEGYLGRGPLIDAAEI